MRCMLESQSVGQEVRGRPRMIGGCAMDAIGNIRRVSPVAAFAMLVREGEKVGMHTRMEWRCQQEAPSPNRWRILMHCWETPAG